MNRGFTHVLGVAGAVGLLGLSSAAHADDSVSVNGVTFYGVVDLGVGYQTHGVPTNPTSSQGSDYLVSKVSNKSIWTMAPNGLGSSRIGIKGADDLGDNWTGLFKLETRFSPASGQLSDGLHALSAQNGVALKNQTASTDSSSAGQAFNGQAYVGISNPTYGTLTFGRQQSLQLDAFGTYDPLQGAFAFSLIGFSGTAGGDGSSEDLRLDNSAKYLVSYGPVRGALMYQFGGTVSRNDIAYAGDLGVDLGPLSIDGVYTYKKDAVIASSLTAAQVLTSPPNSLAGTVSDDTSYSFMAKYVWGPARFYGGYEYLRFANPGSPLPIGTIDIGGYDLSAVTNNAYNHNRILQVSWVGLRYWITSKFEVGGAWYHYDQNSYATGVNTSCKDTRAAQCSGEENAVSLVVDYHFSNRFDAYAGAMYSQVTNGLASGFLHNNNLDPTVGLRLTF